MIKVERLCRKYGDFTAVDNVSFTIETGQIIGLLGHNGAGKTTIMKMLTGFLEPSAGTISIAGLDMPEHRTEIQRKIGYLPENCPVYPEMTVIDYLNYAAQLRGMDNQQCTAAISKAIYKTQLEAKADQLISTLSRGYRQRVGVAQAILSEPDILILDEPTNGLDPTQIHHMRELITGLGQATTIIISTHILHEVQAICDRVLILRDAELALDAKLCDLQNSRQLSLTCNSKPTALRDLIGGYPKLQNIDNAALADGVFEYILELDENENLDNLTPELIKNLTRHNIDIYAINPIQQDLEKVFKQINSVSTHTTGGETHAA